MRINPKKNNIKVKGCYETISCILENSLLVCDKKTCAFIKQLKFSKHVKLLYYLCFVAMHPTVVSENNSSLGMLIILT